jgi:heme/copper-type cytochrome/quinol oxidase subunit 4
MENRKINHHSDNRSNQSNNKHIVSFTLFIIMTVFASTLSSCSIVADIFQAGMSFGIFLVLAIAVLIVYLIMKMRKNP